MATYRTTCDNCGEWFDQQEYNPSDYEPGEGPADVCPNCWDRALSKD